MSDQIVSDPAKQEALRKIIQRLHDGENSAQVKKDFDALVKDVSAEEIAAMEQALMQAGMPAEEIQRLCEVHVDVFEASLKRSGKPNKLPGHPVHTFLAENEAARKSAKRLRSTLRKARLPWSDKERIQEELNKALLDLGKILVHYTRKENQLFPYLEAKGFDAPSKVMWGKHDEIRALFKEVDQLRRKGQAAESIKSMRSLLSKITKMFFMEERILFPAALRKLDEADWLAIRRGESAIGYAWIQPGAVWDPDIAEAKIEQQEPYIKEEAVPVHKEQNTEAGLPSPRDSPDALRLSEGWMSREQIDLMLKHLPVDISFVDEHNRVLYYSDNAERIFPRSPAVIGRNVENCHPPKSVHIVQKIVEAFRNKERKEAEFWIEMGGKFIHIRYFAIYDDTGEYKGTLEVSQDVSGIRALEGQRRLLDWD